MKLEDRPEDMVAILGRVVRRDKGNMASKCLALLSGAGRRLVWLHSRVGVGNRSERW